MATTISGDNGIDKVASGAVDLTTDVTGVLPQAQGGTGASSLPSSVTSLNGQTGAITNTDYGAIGSYVVGFGAAATNYAANSTISGSSISQETQSLYGGFNQITASVAGTSPGFNSVANNTTTSLGLSGTWRCMTNGRGTPAAGYKQFHLWVRIS